MSTLDTITDFTAYLTKKEQFLTGNKVIVAAGEEELLGRLLAQTQQLWASMISLSMETTMQCLSGKDFGEHL